ncbi:MULTISPECIES: phenylacetate--CoA ligase family protein [Staphylococcus]|nr:MULTISPECIES: phenylacetate--CoA ligase family protein [Staphylococcus]MCE4991093.1 phenylacetate--CoA ligase family protein [Staphylococcus haemolyticus]MDO0981052.1 phenylacetate--CoA ligase family protein [Staphylococcus hominis]MDO0985436.1 phenylacetate--CoA ligase family protein [Staphylococcus hominis]PTK87733.1 capsule biosynthesis protein CapK [Staphylococcus haemolyticus]
MLEFIYNHSPIPFQNIMVSVKGKLFEKQRYTKHYYNELEILKECKNPFELQEKRLQEFYEYIKNNSPFFNERLETYGEIIILSELNKFPILTKEDIRQNIDKIITKNKTNLIKAATGGSTGKSLKFYSDSYDMSRKIAYLDFFKEQHGVKKGMRRVSIGGKKIIPNKQKKKIFWRFNEPLNQLLFSAYHVNEENLKFYVNKLNDFKPETLDGYPSVLHRIAKYILKNNVTLKFKPIAIFPTAEALTDEMKGNIEKAFGCPVRNQYASSEGAPFITENSNGNLEICPMTGVFELKQIQGKIYELIVTGFYTTTTPIFRYKIGDSVELFKELPKNYTQKDIKIKRIIGRNNDYITTRDKRLITSVNLVSAVKMVGTKLVESQFIQNKLEEIEVKLVMSDDNFDKDRVISTLKKELKDRVGNEVNFNIYFVDEIEKTNRGKKRFIINNLNKGEIKNE